MPQASTDLDLWVLYRRMFHSRLVEELSADLWRQGLISGEMHLGTGEEAVVAGVLDHLRPDDAMALDHRGTAALLMRGVDPLALLKELMGSADGLCGGRGGHMHLFAPELLAASSGIVGAAGPLAAGLALAAQELRPGSLAAAFFGEGAMNQGMLLESMNLAAAWRLPVVFVCKDNDWAITTDSRSVTAGDLRRRARGLGLAAREVDGLDVEAVWRAAQEAVSRARGGYGPGFLLCRCVHLEGHFLNDPLLRTVRRPHAELKDILIPLISSATDRQGGSLGDRLGALGRVSLTMGQAAKDDLLKRDDPLKRARLRLKKDRPRLESLEAEVRSEVSELRSRLRAPAPEGAHA